MVTPILIASLVVFYFFTVSIIKKRKEKGLPIPGPVGGFWPILGYLVYFLNGGYNEKNIVNLKKYGPICRVKMGFFEIILLNDVSILKEAFTNQFICGRPKMPALASRNLGLKLGIIFNDGETFKKERQFCLAQMKEYGFSKKHNENIGNAIASEVDHLIQSLRERNGAPIEISQLFNIPILNCLFKITTGERYALNDPDMIELMNILSKNLEFPDGVKASFFLPWIGKYFPKLSGMGQYIEDSNSIFRFWERKTKQRINDIKVSLRNKEFVGQDNLMNAYILEEILSFDPLKEPEKNKAACIQDFFIAGSETVSITLCWALLYLASFPNIQENVFDELSQLEVKTIELTHQRSLQYLMAFLHETMRFATIAPFGMFHSTTDDVILQGHFIPKDSIVVSNINAIHKDEKTWGDPHNFRPERFLIKDENEKLKFSNHPSFIAFSYGKRRCIGENMAHEQMFLFISNILLKFKIQFSSTTVVPDLEPVIGAGSVPKKHSISFVPRIV